MMKKQIQSVGRTRGEDGAKFDTTWARRNLDATIGGSARRKGARGGARAGRAGLRGPVVRRGLWAGSAGELGAAAGGDEADGGCHWDREHLCARRGCHGVRAENAG